jgi:hypothetical protein
MIVKKLRIIFIGIVFPLVSFGQVSTYKLDSLNKIVGQSNGGVQFDAMISLMRLQLRENPKEALQISLRAEKIAFVLGDSLRIVKAKYARGFIYRRMDSLNSAIKTLEDANLIARRNHYDQELSKIINTLAIAYSYSGNPDLQ